MRRAPSDPRSAGYREPEKSPADPEPGGMGGVKHRHPGDRPGAAVRAAHLGAEQPAMDAAAVSARAAADEGHAASLITSRSSRQKVGSRIVADMVRHRKTLDRLRR